MAAYMDPSLLTKKVGRITIQDNGEKVPVTIEELNEAYKDWAHAIHLCYQMKRNTTLSRTEFLEQPAKLTDILELIYIPKDL
jgi:deoxyadenosine/deoxycytidine kinase